GPLLLLPLDAVSRDAVAGLPDALTARITTASVAQPWVLTLLGRTRALDDGAAFVDARGAVWLPGATGGAGPLRRRAELFSSRSELAALAQTRESAGTAADAA